MSLQTQNFLLSYLKTLSVGGRCKVVLKCFKPLIGKGLPILASVYGKLFLCNFIFANHSVPPISILGLQSPLVTRQQVTVLDRYIFFTDMHHFCKGGAKSFLRDQVA